MDGHADDLVLMSKTIKGHMYKFRKWNEASLSKCLKVNLVKTSDGQWRHYKGWLV